MPRTLTDGTTETQSHRAPQFDGLAGEAGQRAGGDDPRENESCEKRATRFPADHLHPPRRFAPPVELIGVHVRFTQSVRGLHVRAQSLRDSVVDLISVVFLCDSVSLWHRT